MQFDNRWVIDMVDLARVAYRSFLLACSVLMSMACSATDEPITEKILILSKNGLLSEYDLSTYDYRELFDTKRDNTASTGFRNISIVSSNSILAEKPTIGIFLIDIDSEQQSPLGVLGRCPIFVKSSGEFVYLTSQKTPDGFESVVNAAPLSSPREGREIKEISLNRYADCPIVLDEDKLLFTANDGGDLRYLVYNARTKSVAIADVLSDCKPILSVDRNSVLCERDESFFIADLNTNHLERQNLQIENHYIPLLYLTAPTRLLVQEYRENATLGDEIGLRILDLADGGESIVVPNLAAARGGVAKKP